jgi:hypothetical protein
MTRVSLDLNAETLARVESLARARQMSVEDLLRKRAEDMARIAPIEIQNPAHREIMSALDRRPESYASPREEINDRDKARAEIYAENRQRLLKLIDDTKGDMGLQVWDRSRLYER